MADRNIVRAATIDGSTIDKVTGKTFDELADKWRADFDDHLAGVEREAQALMREKQEKGIAYDPFMIDYDRALDSASKVVRQASVMRKAGISAPLVMKTVAHEILATAAELGGLYARALDDPYAEHEVHAGRFGGDGDHAGDKFVVMTSGQIAIMLNECIFESMLDLVRGLMADCQPVPGSAHPGDIGDILEAIGTLGDLFVGEETDDE